MSKKPSLGHNPLDQNLRNHGSFKFIRKTTKEEVGETVEEKPGPKKVVSYYLEEDIIDKIREMAQDEKKSFSALANELLNSSINSKA
ncbi:MAG: hypothetical protein WC967_11470 [Balneolaceae bacterium]